MQYYRWQTSLEGASVGFVSRLPTCTYRGRNGTQAMMTFKVAALVILKEAQQPLHYREITRRAIEDNLIKPAGATPHLTMLATIGRDIAYKKEKSDFIKVKSSVYYLNARKLQRPKPQHGRIPFSRRF